MRVREFKREKGEIREEIERGRINDYVRAR